MGVVRRLWRRLWRRQPMTTREAVITTFFEPATGLSHPFTERDSYEGTLITGGPGGGKSSGSGRQLACGLLTHGYGGYVATAKSEELFLWANYNPKLGPLGYAALSGVAPTDLIVIGPRLAEYRALGLTVPDGGHAIDVINAEFSYFEKQDPLAATQNVAYLCTTATQAADDSRKTSDAFWADAERQLTLNAVELIVCATGKASLPCLPEVIRTAPRSRADAWSASWRAKSEFWRKYFLPAVSRTPPGHFRHRDLEQAANYWLVEFPELAERTRSVVVTALLSKIAPLLRGSLRPLFAGDKPDSCDLNDSFRGKIFIVDVPLKRFGETGRFAQILAKTAWQRAAERRNPRAEDARSAFLWLEEAQLFVTKHDAAFAQTSRSQRLASFLLTQNISNFYAAIGGSDARAATDSLLGNLQTKIFHANGDAVTNEWAERHFAKALLPVQSLGLSSESTFNRGTQQSLQPVIQAREFTTLRKGGPENNGVVEAIVFQTGRRWDRRGRNFARIAFQQSLATTERPPLAGRRPV